MAYKINLATLKLHKQTINSVKSYVKIKLLKLNQKLIFENIYIRLACLFKNVKFNILFVNFY